GDRAFNRVAVAQVSESEFDLETFERAAVGALADQHAHAVAAFEQRAHDVASHEAVTAGYQRKPGHCHHPPAASARALTAAAAARPDTTALSIVAGRPV